MFILPEYQQFKHIFRRIDPYLIANLTEENLKSKTKELFDAYKQCLRRLENSNGSQPYNLIITRHWMLIVLRTKPSIQGIEVNSLGYIGLMYTKGEE
mmetsp:Transcript_6596/g.4760  ORF Transcript_6596/g.4760 Transcript_6596/m.4760 type:complete len:97 (+) Transcript_6596:805-1095(+)